MAEQTNDSYTSVNVAEGDVVEVSDKQYDVVRDGDRLKLVLRGGPAAPDAQPVAAEVLIEDPAVDSSVIEDGGPEAQADSGSADIPSDLPPEASVPAPSANDYPPEGAAAEDEDGAAIKADPPSPPTPEIADEPEAAVDADGRPEDSQEAAAAATEEEQAQPQTPLADSVDSASAEEPVLVVHKSYASVAIPVESPSIILESEGDLAGGARQTIPRAVTQQDVDAGAYVVRRNGGARVISAETLSADFYTVSPIEGDLPSRQEAMNSMTDAPVAGPVEVTDRGGHEATPEVISQVLDAQRADDEVAVQ